MYSKTSYKNFQNRLQIMVWFCRLLKLKLTVTMVAENEIVKRNKMQKSNQREQKRVYDKKKDIIRQFITTTLRFVAKWKEMDKTGSWY